MRNAGVMAMFGDGDVFSLQLPVMRGPSLSHSGAGVPPRRDRHRLGSRSPKPLNRKV